MRLRRIFVCVLSMLMLIFTTLLQCVPLTALFGENSLRVNWSYTSCYGSMENLRHLIQENRFQARIFPLVRYSVF